MTLPEQGGFNEKLDRILEHLLIDYDFEVVDKDEATYNRAKTAIRTLVLEEIIGEDFKYWGGLETDEQALEAARNRLRAEQRKKLEDSHGTK